MVCRQIIPWKTAIVLYSWCMQGGGKKKYVGIKLWDGAATINVDAVDGELNLSHLPGIERSRVQSGVNLNVIAWGKK